MKKTLSLFLSIVMLFSITAGIDWTAYAANPELKLNNSWVTDYISNSGDIKYYKINLEKDGYLELTFMHYFGARIQVYNENLSQCILNCNDADGTSNHPITNVISGDFSKGIYYVKVCGYLGWSNPITGKYKLKSNVCFFGNNEKEPNNYDSAMHIKCGDAIVGAITIQDDIDWYKIVCDKKCDVTFSLTHYFGISIEVYNSDLSKCVFNSHSSDGNKTSPSTLKINGTLNKGIYYAKVKGYLGWSNPVTGKYRITFIGHTFDNTVTKATLSKNGKTESKCSVCGKTNQTTTIYYPKTIKLNRNTFTTNGKVQRPSVTVYDSKGKQLSYKKDFTVDYSNWSSKNVGRYTVTVKMIGNYSGTKTFPYYINPKPTEFVPSNKGGFKAISKGFTLKWNKQASQTTGYQIQYATKRDFSNAATITIANPNTTSYTSKGRAGNTRYYVRVRTYKKIGNGTFYSSWNSGVKSVVTLR